MPEIDLQEYRQLRDEVTAMIARQDTVNENTQGIFLEIKTAIKDMQIHMACATHNERIQTIKSDVESLRNKAWYVVLALLTSIIGLVLGLLKGDKI